MSRRCLNPLSKLFTLGLVPYLVLSLSISAVSAQWTQKPERVASQVADQGPQEQAGQPPAINWGSGPKPQWIWGDDVTKDYRLTIEFEAPSDQGWMRATCDNVMTLFLNGKRLASSDTWEEAVQVDLGSALKKGKNTLPKNSIRLVNREKKKKKRKEKRRRRRKRERENIIYEDENERKEKTATMNIKFPKTPPKKTK